MDVEQFLRQAWDRYTMLAPDAKIIDKLLRQRGEPVINDHVAFRTFQLPNIDRFACGRVFETWGYRLKPDVMVFPDKKLHANYWLHDNPALPKIFISDLDLKQFPQAFGDRVRALTAECCQLSVTGETFLQPTWKPVTYADYSFLTDQSEYAGWVAAFGIQVNHFTLYVNACTTFANLQSLNEFLLAQGLQLNASGGLVKGTPTDLLVQSSTMARRVPCLFGGGEIKDIMGCYFEFAQRFPDPETKQMFTGFLPKSADKIFESTFELKR